MKGLRDVGAAIFPYTPFGLIYSAWEKVEPTWEQIRDWWQGFDILGMLRDSVEDVAQLFPDVLAVAHDMVDRISSLSDEVLTVFEGAPRPPALPAGR